MWSIDPREFAVLLVDDDEVGLEVMFRDLAHAGFRALAFREASAAVDALKALSRGEAPPKGGARFSNLPEDAEVRVDAVLSDLRMPEMDGVEFLALCRDLAPEAARYVISGLGDLPDAIEAINQAGVHYYFSKPWRMENVRAQLSEGLRHVKTKREAEGLRRTNAENVAAALNDLVRLNNGFRERLARFARDAADRQREQTKALGDRLDMLSGGDVYHIFTPVRRALEESLLESDDFSRYLAEELGARLAQIVSCLNFLQETGGPGMGLQRALLDLGTIFKEAGQAAAPDLRRRRLFVEDRLPPSLGAALGSRALLVEGIAALLRIAAEVSPEGGALFVHPAVRIPDGERWGLRAMLGHREMSACRPETHAMVSIQGQIGVPEEEFREAAESLAARVIGETMRLHGGCAVLGNQHTHFDFTVAVRKEQPAAPPR